MYSMYKLRGKILIKIMEVNVEGERLGMMLYLHVLRAGNQKILLTMVP